MRERQDRSVKILDELQEYLISIKDSWLLEKHPMYQAIHYMLKRFDSFRTYTSDGSFDIDNNAAERAIRPIAVGRRNWLFAGSQHGAQMAAVLMSVVNSCKALKINPQRYLADVLPQLADQATTSIDGLSPFDWNSDP